MARPRNYVGWTVNEQLIEIIAWATRLDQRGRDRTISMMKSECTRVEDDYIKTMKLVEDPANFPSLEEWVEKQAGYLQKEKNDKATPIPNNCRAPTVRPILPKSNHALYGIMPYLRDLSNSARWDSMHWSNDIFKEGLHNFEEEEVGEKELTDEQRESLEELVNGPTFR
jgi:hypothetical protein